LSKAGYGSLKEMEEMDARAVIQALGYETFTSDYEAAYMELNK
jgi:hypothetical protein